MAGAWAVVSFAAAAAAVMLPQIAMLALAGALASAPEDKSATGSWRARAAFSLGAGKFAITVLLAAAAARLLHETGVLAAEYFVGGAIAAVAFNVAALMRRAAKEG